MNIFNLIREEFNNTTMTFYHGGNLDNIEYSVQHKKGRFHYGVGLYLTDHYSVAQKYNRGGRKLYIVEVSYGNNISDAFIPYEDAINFIKRYTLVSKRNDIIFYLDKRNENGKVPANMFNNLLLNHDAIKGKNLIQLHDFLNKNKIDYELHDNHFGFGDTTMTLINKQLIKSVTRVNPKDKVIEMFNNTYN